MLVHIPDKGHGTTRYDGWYANRPRGICSGMRRQAESAEAGAPLTGGLTAALLQQLFEVDPPPGATLPCGIVAFITQTLVIDQILTHLRTRATTAEPPSTRASSASRASRRPTAAPSAV